jgi:hypothetical protein
MVILLKLSSLVLVIIYSLKEIYQLALMKEINFLLDLQKLKMVVVVVVVVDLEQR